MLLFSVKLKKRPLLFYHESVIVIKKNLKTIYGDYMVIIFQTRYLKSTILMITHSATIGMIKTTKAVPIHFQNSTVDMPPVILQNRARVNNMVATRLKIQADMPVKR